MATNGNRSKFSDRLRLIIKFKSKRKKSYIEIEDTNKIYMNFIKVIAAIPGLVYGNIVYNKEDKNSSFIDDIKSNCMIEDNNSKINGKKNFSHDKKENRLDNIKVINEINVDDIKKSQEKFFRSKGHNLEYNKENLYVKDNGNIYKKAKELEKSIINLIKKDLIKIVNDMEILQSELYILSEVNGESKILKDCQRELNQIKNMICKIDKLKEQYDFLRDNYDFEYLLEIDNNDLVDKIIELKNTFGNNELKAVSEDYKLLEVYKYLYLKIDDLQAKTIKFEDKKREEENKLKERDIDFEKLKNDVYNIEYANRNYDSFVDSQNNLLRMIDKDISKINSYEQTSYYLKGFNELFRNSFKYFGLLMISPLKGVIPSIATETLITGNLIKNLYKNLEWQEEKRMVYEAIDYSNMIGNAINDLESTNRIVDTTLDDIVHLKMRYNEKFREYHGDFLEYQEIMKKISDMENKILGNKIKIEMMRKKSLEQKKNNDKKMVLIKELNQKGN